MYYQGCYLESTSVIPEYSYDAHGTGEHLKFDSAQGCQEACQGDSRCFFFQYNKADQQCWYKKDRALLATKQNETSNKFKNRQYTSTADFIFGPKYCNGTLIFLFLSDIFGGQRIVYQCFML